MLYYIYMYIYIYYMWGFLRMEGIPPVVTSLVSIQTMVRLTKRNPLAWWPNGPLNRKTA